MGWEWRCHNLRRRRGKGRRGRGGGGRGGGGRRSPDVFLLAVGVRQEQTESGGATLTPQVSPEVTGKWSSSCAKQMILPLQTPSTVSGDSEGKGREELPR